MGNLSASDRRRLARELRYAATHDGIYLYAHSSERMVIFNRYMAERKVVLRRWLTAAKARQIVDAALPARRPARKGTVKRG